MAKIFLFGDVGTPTGFGRIINEVGIRLSQRGHQVMGAGIYYDGMHPHNLPFFVAPLAGRDIWLYTSSLITETQPDVVISCQDFPYHTQLYYGCRLDFSKFRWVFITPIDGTPIHRDWIKLVDVADGAMTISKFGVEAFRQQGKKVELLQPGINQKEFYPMDKKAIRAKAGLAEDLFILGTMAQNQGRKAIPFMLQSFFEFAKDKDNARYFLDMEKTSPAGWDILSLVEAMGEKPDKLLFKENYKTLTLPERYNILDVHMVLSHREGYGLPLQEAMACKVPSAAMDWCSGTEICGSGNGILVSKNHQTYKRYSTWGNAIDYDPDVQDVVYQLDEVYYNPLLRGAIADRGYNWAISHTWDKATDQVEKVLQTALERPQHVRPDFKFLNTFVQPVNPGLNGTITPSVLERQEVSAEGPLKENPSSNEVNTK